MEKKSIISGIIGAVVSAFLMLIVYFIVNNWILNRQEKRLNAEKLQDQIIEIAKSKENKIDATAKYQELKYEIKDKVSAKEVQDLKDNIDSKFNGLKDAIKEVNDKSDKLIYMHLHALRIDTVKPLAPRNFPGVICKTVLVLDSVLTSNMIYRSELQ